MKPYVVKYIKDRNDQIIRSFEPVVVDRVISSDTAKRVTEILKGVVEKGTGTKAMIEGMGVAGKTGTAQKVIDGLYSNSKFYATFVGFAPTEKPRLAAIVVFDEPRPRYFGGTVSAPVFKEVVEKSLKYLQNAETTEFVRNIH
jgi:cell division protein FtsI/penicillin-binding protein 2